MRSGDNAATRCSARNARRDAPYNTLRVLHALARPTTPYTQLHATTKSLRLGGFLEAVQVVSARLMLGLSLFGHLAQLLLDQGDFALALFFRDDGFGRLPVAAPEELLERGVVAATDLFGFVDLFFLLQVLLADELPGQFIELILDLALRELPRGREDVPRVGLDFALPRTRNQQLLELRVR